MTMGTAQDPLRGMTADAMAITPAVFDSQIEECIPQVRACGGVWAEPLFVYASFTYLPCLRNHTTTTPQIATLLASTKVDGPVDTMRRNRWIEQQVLEKCTTNVHLGLKIYWLLRAALGHLEVPTRRGLPQITGVRILIVVVAGMLGLMTHISIPTHPQTGAATSAPDESPVNRRTAGPGRAAIPTMPRPAKGTVFCALHKLCVGAREAFF
jgi:hypothetical protein